jgi:transposase-like protein
LLADRFLIGVKVSLEQWVEQMRQYSPEERAAAMAAILTGSSLGEVAKQFGIPKSTVALWRSEQSVQQVSVPKKETIAEQLYGFLQESIITLQTQMIFFRREDWLERQSAADVAILHGVLSDKATRMLTAFRAQSADIADGHV